MIAAAVVTAIALLSAAQSGEDPGGPRWGPRQEQDPPPEETESEQADTEAEEAVGEEQDPVDRIAALEARIEELEARVEAAEAETTEPWVRFSGYADLGFFVPRGSGVGVVGDTTGSAQELAGRYAWVFLGDLLSTAVNTRGEAADLGELPGVARFDSVGSKGAASFILNELNLAANVTLGERLFFTGSVNVVPRSGDEFSIGDFIELDLAQLEWLVTKDASTSLYAGKITPVMGIEYKSRKPTQRFGITPSLLARYTTGTQLGIKARSRLFDEWLILTAAVTNGPSVIEAFHFSREIDTNDGKSISGRIAIRIPIGALAEADLGQLEIGTSAQYGAQDRAFDSDSAFWMAGADVEYSGVGLTIRGELATGGAPGRATDGAYALDLKRSGYLEVSYLILPELGLLARIDFRDALVELGAERAYLSQVWRLTGGARAVISTHLAVKAEYLRNEEYGQVPNIDNDVFTSSLVVSF